MSGKDRGISRRGFLELSAASAALLSMGAKPATLTSPLGERAADSTGSPVAAVRMNPNESYVGVPKLLQKYINDSDGEAWRKIGEKIDYTYQNLDYALGALETETGFGKELKARIARGQKLLFKPNLVGVMSIDGTTHGPGFGSTMNTEWSYIAALMRWFHDKLGVSYYQMSLGEAASAMPMVAAMGTQAHPSGQTVTPEGALEGKTGDYYMGWGFYFARKYLADRLGPNATEDPMRGHAESVNGTYIPPGQVTDKLMVYDLNRIYDDVTKGRDVPVPGGVNYHTITVHKAIVGGDPADAADREAYPGCILINVPKFKVHDIALITNVIKNLGIGLYPMQSAKTGGTQWDYATPHRPVPGMKVGIPHQVWVAELDHATGLPRRDTHGKHIVHKTGGIVATMVDIIAAVKNQDIFMVHVVDGIETVNFSNSGGGSRVPEGLAFAGLDPVATDLLCARVLLCGAPLAAALEAGLKDRAGGTFAQEVPLPTVQDGNIVTGTAYDCMLARDFTFEKAEERGLGHRQYYVVGQDAQSGRPMVSLEGHLGTVRPDGAFADVGVSTTYYSYSKVPWDLQRTALAYLEASDRLNGTHWKQTFLDTYDEDGDGIVTYDEYGRRGALHPGMYLSTCRSTARIEAMQTGNRVEPLRIAFCASATTLRHSRADWNEHGDELFRDEALSGASLTALFMSRNRTEAQDGANPSMTYGNGKWPSVDAVMQQGLRTSVQRVYSAALAYADAKLNGGKYRGRSGVEKYTKAVQKDPDKAIDFVLYIPKGATGLFNTPPPNIEETEDKTKIFTAHLNEGKEILPGPAPFA